MLFSFGIIHTIFTKETLASTYKNISGNSPLGWVSCQWYYGNGLQVILWQTCKCFDSKSPTSWSDQVCIICFDTVNFHTYIRNDICISYSLLFLNSVDNLSSNLKLDNCQLSCVVNANINIVNILAIHCLFISSYKFWRESFGTRCPLIYIVAFLFTKGISINSCRWYRIGISVIINCKKIISTCVSVST